MLVLSLRAPDDGGLTVGADDEAVAAIDLQKLFLLVRLESEGVPVEGLKPADLQDADLLEDMRTRVDPKLFTRLVEQCTMTIRVVNVHSGRTAQLGFDADTTTLFTRAALIPQLARDFEKACAGNTKLGARLNRGPWFMKPLFRLVLMVLSGNQSARDDDQRPGLPAAG